MNQILIDKNDNDKTFVARPNDIIMITLKENATTGYRWKVDRIDEEIILLDNSQYSMNTNSSVGSGVSNFHFQTTFNRESKGALESEKRMGKGDRSN